MISRLLCTFPARFICSPLKKLLPSSHLRVSKSGGGYNIGPIYSTPHFAPAARNLNNSGADFLSCRERQIMCSLVMSFYVFRIPV